MPRSVLLPFPGHTVCVLGDLEVEGTRREGASARLICARGGSGEGRWQRAAGTARRDQQEQSRALPPRAFQFLS